MRNHGVRSSLAPVLLAAWGALAAAPSLHADVWDLATANDDGLQTDNGLVHGVEQDHDLAAKGTILAPDQDFYRFFAFGRSSYEVVVDNDTGDVNLSGADVSRLDADGDLLQNSVATETTAPLRWRNDSANAEINYIRVTGASCGSQCTADDRYRIRAYETTYSFPRFNNTSGQATILSIASVVSFPCSGNLHFYEGNGNFLGTRFVNWFDSRLQTVNTAQTAIAAGKSGWIVVTHTCGYGGLAGKAVALEPATGFTFDTPLLPVTL